MLKLLRTGKLQIDLYATLVTAKIAGRVVSGVAKALILSPGITMKYWITASFVTALPGIIIQLIAVPLVVNLLKKIRYIPKRYPKGEPQA